MSIEEKTLSQEEAREQKQSIREKSETLAEDILKDMDLGTTESETDETETEDDTEAVKTESGETEDSSESEEEHDSASEDEAEAEDEEEEETDPLEDLKSTFQKRIDQITAKNKALEAELERIKGKDEVDPDLAKLEQMPSEELQRLKRQVRVEAAKSARDEARLNQLLDLEDKIETVIQSAPKKLEQTQIKNFQNAVAESIEQGVVPQDEKTLKSLFATAKQFFEEFPEFQRSQKDGCSFIREATQAIDERSQVKAGEQ